MDEPEITTVTLERMKFVILKYLSAELVKSFAIMPDVEFSTHAGWLADDVVMRVKHEIYGRIMDEKYITYPADWWQAFKDRWFPAWAKRWWPVRMKQHTLKAVELYPLVTAPRQESWINLQRIDEMDWWKPPPPLLRE